MIRRRFAVTTIFTIAALALAANGDSYRWDLAMIDQAETWHRLVQDYEKRGQPTYWVEHKPVLEQISYEQPPTAWADDAILCLAGGIASYEGNLNEGIRILQEAVGRLQEEDTVVSHWISDSGCEFDTPWILHAMGLVAVEGDTIIARRPFDSRGLSYQELEILAYWEHFHNHPILTRHKARVIMAQMLAAKGDTSGAIAELEGMIAEQPASKLIALVSADRQAASSPNGYLIGHVPLAETSPVWHSEFDPYLQLCRLYESMGDRSKAAEVLGTLVSSISPAGWHWTQNARLGDMYAGLGRWQDAHHQYEVAVAGILASAETWVTRREALAHLGEVILPGSAKTWQEVALRSEWYGGSLTRMKEKVAETQARVP